MAEPNISEEVYFEMLEKKADGTFKAKYPKVKSKSIEVLCYPSDTIQASAPSARKNQYDEPPKKMKEVRVPCEGMVRVKFNFCLYGAGSTCYAQLHVNGTPVGIQHTTSSTDHTKIYTEDISINKNDLVQLYAWATGGPGSVEVRKFNICYDVKVSIPSMPSEVIQD